MTPQRKQEVYFIIAGIVIAILAAFGFAKYSTHTEMNKIEGKLDDALQGKVDKSVISKIEENLGDNINNIENIEETLVTIQKKGVVSKTVPTHNPTHEDGGSDEVTVTGGMMASNITFTTTGAITATTFRSGGAQVSGGNVTGASGNISQWTNNTGYITGIGGENLNDLGDVNTPAPNNNEVLTWNALANEWQATLAPPGAEVDPVYSANLHATGMDQDVDTTASPTFNGMTLNGNLEMNGNNINNLPGLTLNGNLDMGGNTITNVFSISMNGNIDLNGNDIVDTDDITATGTIQGGTLTDGTASFTAGALTGATGNISMWTNDTGYLTIEADPVFTAWDKSTGISITESQISDLQTYALQSITISAGTGLTGGGNLSANRTLSLSHLGIESLVDPNANNLIGWDDTDNATKWLTLGSGLSYDHASHTVSGTGVLVESDPIYSANAFAVGMNQQVATTASPTFAGLNLGTGSLNTVGDIVYDATTIRTIGANTADAADTGRIQLVGGGAFGTVRGANIYATGNEYGVNYQGTLYLGAGNSGGAGTYDDKILFAAGGAIPYYLNNTAFYPSADSTFDIGTSSNYVRYAYTDNLYLGSDVDLHNGGAGILFLGASGGGDRDLDIQSGTAGKYLRFASYGAGGYSLISAVSGYLFINSTTSYMVLRSPAGQSMYFDAGGLFYFRDSDASYASRLYIDSSNGDVIPVTDSASDLGNSSLYFAYTYTDRLYLNSTAYLDGATAGGIGVNGAATAGFEFDINGNLRVNVANSHIMLDGATTDAVIQVATSTLKLADWASSTKGVGIDLTTGNFAPLADSGMTLGSSSAYWQYTYTDRLYLNSTAYLDGVTTAGNITLTGRLGIGVDPATIFHVQSTLPRIQADTTSQYATFQFAQNGTQRGATYVDTTSQVIILEAAAGYTLRFNTNGATTRFTISDSAFAPATNSTYNLGTSGPLYFANSYIDRMYLNSTAYLDGANAGMNTMVGVLGVPAGTVAAPSITFSGDPDTGLYSYAGNVLGFSVGGTFNGLWTGGELTVYNGATVGGAVRYLTTNVSWPTFYNGNDPNTGMYFPAADTIGLVAGGVGIATVTSTGIALPGADDTIGSSVAGDAQHGTIEFRDTGTGNMVITPSNAGAVQRNLILAAGHFNPNSAGTQSLGDATNYWNDVSYKTLTDRGCLGLFDSGVEMQDGSFVSDIAALEAIKTDGTQTVYGVPKFDYSSMPKSVYKPAYGNGEDGAETTALISIMIGAIKEANNRLLTLEDFTGVDADLRPLADRKPTDRSLVLYNGDDIYRTFDSIKDTIQSLHNRLYSLENRTLALEQLVNGLPDTNDIVQKSDISYLTNNITFNDATDGLVVQKDVTFAKNVTVEGDLEVKGDLKAPWRDMQKLTEDPDTTEWGEKETGRIWFNTTDAVIKMWDGKEIKEIKFSD